MKWMWGALLAVVLLLFAVPVFAQTPPLDPGAFKFTGISIYGGVGYDSTATPNVLVMGGFAYPVVAKAGTFVIANWDVTAQEGTRVKDMIRGNGLTFTFQGAIAQKVPKLEYGPITTYVIVALGPNIGPGEVAAVSSIDVVLRTPLDVRVALAYGGFFNIKIKYGLNVDLFIQNKGVFGTTDGFKPVVRLALRYIFK